MNAMERQATAALRNLMNSLDAIINQLNSPAFEVAGYELVVSGDLDRVNFSFECAFNLGAGE